MEDWKLSSTQCLLPFFLELSAVIQSSSANLTLNFRNVERGRFKIWSTTVITKQTSVTLLCWGKPWVKLVRWPSVEQLCFNHNHSWPLKCEHRNDSCPVVFQFNTWCFTDVAVICVSGVRASSLFFEAWGKASLWFSKAQNRWSVNKTCVCRYTPPPVKQHSPPPLCDRVYFCMLLTYDLKSPAVVWCEASQQRHCEVLCNRDVCVRASIVSMTPSVHCSSVVFVR